MVVIKTSYLSYFFLYRYLYYLYIYQRKRKSKDSEYKTSDMFLSARKALLSLVSASLSSPLFLWIRLAFYLFLFIA